MLIMLRAFLVAQTVKNLPAMFDPWIGKIKYNIYTPWAGLHACLLSRFSRVRLFQTLWTVAHQAPLSMGFSRKEYWSRLPFPYRGDLPDPVIKPGSPALQADSLWSQPPKTDRINQLYNVCSTHFLFQIRFSKNELIYHFTFIQNAIEV